jgi:hypothetical protein
MVKMAVLGAGAGVMPQGGFKTHRAAKHNGRCDNRCTSGKRLPKRFDQQSRGFAMIYRDDQAKIGRAWKNRVRITRDIQKIKIT